MRGRTSANFNPSLDTLTRLAEALGVDLADLLLHETVVRPRADRLSALLDGLSPAMLDRVQRVVEALVCEERPNELPRSTRRPVQRSG